MINNILLQIFVKSFFITITLTSVVYGFIAYLNKTIIYNKWPQHAQHSMLVTGVMILLMIIFIGFVDFKYNK
jgi:hypothetical protein